MTSSLNVLETWSSGMGDLERTWSHAVTGLQGHWGCSAKIHKLRNLEEKGDVNASLCTQSQSRTIATHSSDIRSTLPYFSAAFEFRYSSLSHSMFTCIVWIFLDKTCKISSLFVFFCFFFFVSLLYIMKALFLQSNSRFIWLWQHLSAKLLKCHQTHLKTRPRRHSRAANRNNKLQAIKTLELVNHADEDCTMWEI